MNAQPGAAPTGWTATAGPSAVVNRLRLAKRVVVLTHTRPDGDALGSSLALTRSLLQAGAQVELWLVPPGPRWMREIIGDAPVRLHNPSAGTTMDQAIEPDAIVILDTGAWKQVEEVAPWVRPRSAKAIIIDHHLSGDAEMAPIRLIDSGAAAAAEVVAEVCVGLLGKSSAGELPLDVARPLYLGLATDTGWFRFSNTRPQTLRLAAALKEAGVDAPALYQLVEQQDRPARLRLYGRALSSIELHAAESIAFLSLTQRDFEECRGDAEDTTGFASDVLSVASIQVGALLTEVAGRGAGNPGREGPLTKVSLRSKPGAGAIDVAALTLGLGGGGHARAAGVKLAMPLSEAKQALLAALVGGSMGPAGRATA